MIRRVLSGASLLAMVMGGMVFAQGGVAEQRHRSRSRARSPAASPEPLNFGPALVNGGTTADTVSVKADLLGCSGPGASGGGVTLSGGKLSATASSTINNNCGAVFNGSSLPALTGGVTWKGSGGKIDASSISINGASALYDPNGDNGGGAFDVSLPTSVTAGSYNGESGTPSGLTSDKRGGMIDAKCGRKGVKSIPVGKRRGDVVTGSVTIQAGS